MEPKTSIKQHDFISGEPRNKYFVFGDYDFSDIRIMPSTNPCGEISLGGFQQGKLGVVMAPAGVGKTGMMNRLMESMGEGRQVINMDYMSLYPEVRRLNEVNPDMTLRDFMVMRERDRRIQEELRESIEGMGETINKLTLNSIY
jgi:hypothetical protein